MNEGKFSGLESVEAGLDRASELSGMRSSGWRSLDDRRKAYAVAFVDEGYSHVRAADRLGIAHAEALRLQRDSLVQACIQDIQSQLQGVSFLNEAWVDAKIAEMFPMVMGEVDVPMVDAKTGSRYTAKKFMPEVAVRLLDLKVPKKPTGAGTGAVSIASAMKMAELTDDELESMLTIAEKLNSGGAE